VFEIDESVCWPEAVFHLFPGDNLTRTLEKHDQDLEGLALQPDSDPKLAQFSGPQV
jgi:hypothetical protein